MAAVYLDYNHLPAVMRTIENEADRLPHTIADFTQDIASANAPIRTGWLQSRIRVEHTGVGEFSVISDTGDGAHREYAAYNEYGTRYMAAQPYMMPAYVEGFRFVSVEAVALGTRIETSARTGTTL